MQSNRAPSNGWGSWAGETGWNEKNVPPRKAGSVYDCDGTPNVGTTVHTTCLHSTQTRCEENKTNAVKPHVT